MKKKHIEAIIEILKWLQPFLDKSIWCSLLVKFADFLKKYNKGFNESRFFKSF